MLSQANAEVHRAAEIAVFKWDVVEVKAGPDRRLHVRFADGTVGIVRFDDVFFTGVLKH